MSITLVILVSISLCLSLGSVRAVGSGTTHTALAIPLFNQGLVKSHCTLSV